MANLSDANIQIQATGCLKELLAYIDATNERQPIYHFVADGYTIKEKTDDNSGWIEGSAVGRWAWDSNLENYLSVNPEETPIWIKAYEKTEWTIESDEEYKKEQTARKKMREAYEALLKKIKETKHACIEIYWTDYEGGCNYFVEGEAYFDAVEGLSVNSIDQLDLTPENLVEYGHYDCIDDAKEDLGIE